MSKNHDSLYNDATKEVGLLGMLPPCPGCCSLLIAPPGALCRSSSSSAKYWR